jgi:hypothetical protein
MKKQPLFSIHGDLRDHDAYMMSFAAFLTGRWPQELVAKGRNEYD